MSKSGRKAWGGDSPERELEAHPALLSHPELTGLTRAQGGEAHPLERDRQCRVDLPRDLPPGCYE
jgi:hypothetical protein